MQEEPRASPALLRGQHSVPACVTFRSWRQFQGSGRAQEAAPGQEAASRPSGEEDDGWGGNGHPLRNLPGDKRAGTKNSFAGAWELWKTRRARPGLSLPAPGTCGSPFPRALIRPQLPAPGSLWGFPDHLGGSISAAGGNTGQLLPSASSLPCQNPKRSQFPEQSLFPGSPEPPGPMVRVCKSFLLGCANTSGSKAAL